jgi:hypothetical protein
MNVDDDFWFQIEDKEPGTTLASPSPPSPQQGSRTGSSGLTRDVIALDDDDSDEPDDWIFGTGAGWKKEGVSDSHVRAVTPPLIPSSQPRSRHRPPTQLQEVIDLSD